MSLLDALYRGGQLRTLDHALARTLQRLDPGTPDAVLAAAALASLAVAQGHAGLRLDAPAQLVDADVDWPDADAWQRQLAASPWVSTPDNPADIADPHAPLVLDAAPGAPPLLYLRRYREYERRMVAGLRRIAAPAAPAVADDAGIAALAPLFAQLFPPAHADPQQARAAALALRHRLLLVTGGPGTGKTTTIARLLALLAAQAVHADRAPPRVALAAPTGRAAERMADSVRAALRALADAGIDPALLAALPTTGTTLHRLLGTIPDSPRFRHGADHPLPFDTVVVDEASMIDLPLMAKLVEAVPDGARLVLLGDPDQLPSVEAGDVLAGILGAAGDGLHLPPEDAAALRPLLDGAASPKAPTPNALEPPGRHPRAGGDPASLPFEQPMLPGFDPNPPTPPRVFPARRIHLHYPWRQADTLQLAPLAAAVRAGDSARTLSLLRGGALPGVRFHEGLADPLQSHRDALLDHWRSLATAATPADALARAGRLRLLTAVREGPQGARTLNARIEALLMDAGHAARRAAPGGGHRAAQGRHFHGRLLLVTENGPRHRLFNGDIGVVLHGTDGTPTAWFPGDAPDAPRPFHPAALPAHDSAFAMTVHKAQGSEFDTVWLLLPERFNRVLSRELVYTGITRARRELHVAGSGEVIAEALGRNAGRWSGLGWRLGNDLYSLHV